VRQEVGRHGQLLAVADAARVLRRQLVEHGHDPVRFALLNMATGFFL
jgi:hypothetical protein